MRRFNLTFRTELYSDRSAVVPITLCEIDHPDMVDGPVRFSSDPTERISADPYIVGTYHFGIPYYFGYTQIGIAMPGDRRGAPAAASIIFSDLEAELSAIAHSIITPAEVTLKIVQSNALDTIVEQFSGLLSTRVTSNTQSVTLEFSRDVFSDEPCPPHLMSPSRRPGLFAQ